MEAEPPEEEAPRPDDGARRPDDERAPADEIGRQWVETPVFTRKGLERLTPVVGTAQPPRGLSGPLRRAAYELPEHRFGHWGLLMLADRVDVLEGRLGSNFGRALERIGLKGLTPGVERHPLPAAAGFLVAGVLVARALRGRRS